ncbi:MAG: type II secretion system protein GspC [Gammaproteobacteria bacterium]|nr:type II secretion system protein GspC [Gammaproteobacteria bacterium]
MTRTFNQLFTHSEQLQPLLKRLPVVINFLLIIACAQLLSQGIWMLLAEPESEFFAATPSANSGTDKNADNAQKSQQQAFRSLTSAHLFGVAQNQGPQMSAEKAPDTKLNLVLRGILTAGETQMASAIIARGANGQEEIYGIDDKMPGGITLREIHAQHVIIERQGQLETLRMEKDEGDDLISAPVGRPQSSTSTMSALASQKIKNIRRELISNPTSFSKYALPVVVRENGVQVGYRLQPQQNSDLLRQAGLEASDVITSVNGVSLNDMNNSISALRELSSASQVNIIVKRNGVEIPLNIQLQ